MANLSRVIVGLVCVWILPACEQRQSTRIEEPPKVSGGSWTSEAEPLPEPNAYQARLKWKEVTPAGGELLRKNRDGSFKTLSHLRAVSGDWVDTDVQPTQTYEYFLRFENNVTPVTSIKIPEDYVADNPKGYQPGRIVGYNRLFIFYMIVNEPVHIEVNEIISKELVNDCGVIFTHGTPFWGQKEAPDGQNGRDGQDIYVKTRRLTGRINLDATGQDGGKGDTQPGKGGKIYFEVKEPTKYRIRANVRLARKGSALQTAGAEMSRLGEMNPITIKVAGNTVYSAQTDLLFPGVEGLYDGQPYHFVTPDGLRYRFQTVRENKKDKIMLQLRDNIWESGFVWATQLNVAEQEGWPNPVHTASLDKTVKNLVLINQTAASLKHILYPDFKVATVVPEAFTDAESPQLAFLEVLIKSPEVLKVFLKKKALTKIRIDIGVGEEFRIENDTLIIPHTSAVNPKDLVAALEKDELIK